MGKTVPVHKLNVGDEIFDQEGARFIRVSRVYVSFVPTPEGSIRTLTVEGTQVDTVHRNQLPYTKVHTIGESVELV